MPTSHKHTRTLWRYIGLMALLIAALLLPTLKWGGLLEASELNNTTASATWKASSLPRTPEYFGRGSKHKIQVSDPKAAEELASQGGRLLADYGSYKLFEADATTARSFHDQNRGDLNDESNLILLNAGIIDTSSADVQAMRRNFAKPSGKATGMRMVQFVGAVKPEWHAALAETGVRIVTYIPNNAYLVYGDGTALANMRQWAANSDFVQWDGDYNADHRIDPGFYQAKAKQVGGTTGLMAKLGGAQVQDFDHVIMQLVVDAAANQNTLNSVRSLLGTGSIVRNTTDIGYVNVVAKLPAGVTADSAAKNLATRSDVVSIQPYKIPVKFDERQNMIMAANLTGNVPNTGDWLAYLATNGFTQAQFNSSNFAVNISDSGVDDATTSPNHFGLFTSGDLTMASRIIYNRLLGTPNGGSTLQGCDGHGTINAHIVGGFVPTGTVGAINYGAFPHADASGFRYGLGVAPFVKMGSSVIFDPNFFTNPDYEDLESQAYNDGVRISTNSWGAAVGGAYNSDAQRYDALVRDSQPTGSTFPVAGNQENVILFAAGNRGSGANTTGSPATGKNVITVGAAENVHPHGEADGCGVPDTGADSANDIIDFSSRGPCDDGRVKPEIMAPGTHVTGGVFQANAVATGNGVAAGCFNAGGVCALGSGNFFPVGQQFYTTSSGTSHSTPAVAGAAALIRQRFINGGLAPASPAMTKAILMNSARYMTGVGANDNLFSNNQGMGEVNLTQFFDIQLGTVGTTPTIVRDQVGAEMFTASGQMRTYTGTVNNNTKPFRVVLAWTDPPGPTSGNAFINNLDLEVTVGGNTYKGNVFTGANSATGGTADIRNNSESVFVPAGVSGNFIVTVKATNIAGDGVPGVGGALDQDFALVVYNADQAAVAVIGSAGSQLITESCTPANGVPDPGEDITMSFSLQNVGTLNTTNLVATLQATGGVIAPSAPQNYGALIAGGAAVSRNFSFTVDPMWACGTPITVSLQLQDGATNLGVITYNFQTGVLNTIFTENFDSVTAPALPAGWTSSFTNGSGNCSGTTTCALGTDWTTVASTPDTAPNAAFHNNPSCVTDNLLISPTIAISSAAAQLTFRNNHNTENTFDGGVLEIKIGAGSFTDIIAAGGSFVTGGYNGVINSGATDFLNPLRGRNAWTGNSGGYITTTVNLPAAAAGQNIQLRWRLGTDCSVSATGWRVDTISVTDGYTCATSCGPQTCMLVCPTNIVTPATAGQCSAVVTYNPPTTGGTCGTVTCSPASGSTFNVGTTTVSCSSSVGGGSCSFTVTVQDTQAPTIACPTNQTAHSASGNPIPVTYPAPTVGDNCPGVGSPTCVPSSGSNFPVGVTTVTCTVDDASANSSSASCTFTVTVTTCTIACPTNQTANTAPGTCAATVSYPAPTTTGTCGTVTCTPASGSSFPKGVTTVNCSVSGGPSCSFTVTVNDNQPPTITCPSNQIVVSPSGNPIAVSYAAPTVSDNCPGVGSPTCNPVSGATFPIGTTTVTCTVSDADQLTTACSFTVTVTTFTPAPTTNLQDPLVCVGPGGKVNGSFGLTNTTQIPQTGTVTTALSPQIIGLPGTCTANVGSCTVNATTVSWSGTLAGGQTLVVNYMAQLADDVQTGAQACVTTTAVFNAVTGTVTACLTVNCPPIGPGGIYPARSEASDQKAGSVLVYNIYTSSTDPTRQNTRINLTNTHLLKPAYVHLFFVAEGCAVADSFVCLTPNQTTSFLASDLDPGTTGYLVAVATDAIGCPTSFNYLIGDEYVKFNSGHAANLGAIAFSQLAGGLPLCDGNSVTATLNFDGISYNRTPAVLALSNIGSRADGNDTLLILNRIGGNLGIGAASLGSLFGILYDDAENALSFSVTGGCQLRSSINNNFPRTTPRFETFVPAGRTGWLRIYNQTGAIGMTGAAINFNANAASSAGAFNQGHNLHHLTLNNTMNYIIPIFPPSC